MKKNINIIIIAIAAICFIQFIGCDKVSDVVDQSTNNSTNTEKRIPVAKLTETNDIELLFLQKDVQKYLLEEMNIMQKNSGEELNNNAKKLVFIDVVDDNMDNAEAGLLYRIYDEDTKIVETSVSIILTLEDKTYYLQDDMDYLATAANTTCKSKDCANSGGCQPVGYYCSKCKKSDGKEGDCERTTSSGLTNSVKMVMNALQNAALAY